MKSWWKDTVNWLMIGTGLLVILLSVFWIRSAFLDAKEDLSRETSYLFAHAVRSLEDSLIQRSFLGGLNAEGRKGVHTIRIDADSLSSSHGIFGVIKKRLTTMPAEEGARRRRWHRRAMGFSERGFGGTLGLHLQVLDSTDLQLAFTQKVDHQAVFAALEQAVLPVFSKQDYPFSYQLVAENIPPPPHDSIDYHSAVDHADHDLTTRIYHDMSSDRRYFVALNQTSPYLFSKIRFQIIFCLLLIVLTCATFYLSFRALFKERKLTQLRKDLVSNITHELKTPIATVKVALEAIQNFNAGSDVVKRKEYLQIAETELDRLALLVDSVLKTSVQEGTEMTLQMQRIDLTVLVKNILSTMQLQFDKLHAKVKLDIRTKPMWVDGDKIHLTSVIYNLLDNALKYSANQPQINVRLEEEDKHYKLSITDAGIGMEKEELTKIFDKFYRAPQSDIHDTKGYGLGLSYVADVIKKHAGTIQVTSTKGLGSTFIIAMPQSNQ